MDGRGTVYDSQGTLMLLPNETVIRVAEGWDMHVWTPWRRVRPKVIFLGFNPPASSRLYITSQRIVLIRDIDAWREVAGEMTPLGMPTAIAKQAKLKALKEHGVRAYCALIPGTFRVAESRKNTKRGSWIQLHVEDSKGERYALSFWKTDGKDDKTLSAIQARFGLE